MSFQAGKVIESASGGVLMSCGRLSTAIDRVLLASHGNEEERELRLKERAETFEDARESTAEMQRILEVVQRLLAADAEINSTPVHNHFA